MNIYPSFLALLVAMILLATVLGSDYVPWWRIALFFVFGVFCLWSITGAYSYFGPGPALDATGETIKDMNGNPLYRANDATATGAIRGATLYFGFGCLIASLMLGFVKLFSNDIRFRKTLTK